MRKRLVPVLLLPAVIVLLAMPASVSASGSSFSYTVVTDQCLGEYGFTNYFRVLERAEGFTGANKLTIASWGQTMFAGEPPWHTDQTWPLVTTRFAADGTAHTLGIRRNFPGGNIEALSRIKFRLRAWAGPTLLWSQTIYSRIC